jgi:hypothetical protein
MYTSKRDTKNSREEVNRSSPTRGCASKNLELKFVKSVIKPAFLAKARWRFPALSIPDSPQLPPPTLNHKTTTSASSPTSKGPLALFFPNFDIFTI